MSSDPSSDIFKMEYEIDQIRHANGYSYPIFFRKFLKWLGFNDIWLIVHDICSIFCSGFAFSTICLTNFITVRYAILPTFKLSFIGVVVFIVYEISITMIVLTLLKTMFTQPGIVPALRELTIKEIRICQQRDEKICIKCCYYKPYRAHHCSTCNACVLKMDHHCPWVNTCVGINNQKYFIQFLVYVAIGEFFSLVLLGYRGYFCFNNLHICVGGMHTPGIPWVLIATIVTGILSFLFFCFVIGMAWDQYEAIAEDLTFIEALKRAKTRDRSWRTFYSGLVDVFGEPFNFNWFLPRQGPWLQEYNHFVMNQLHAPHKYTEKYCYSDDEDDDKFSKADLNNFNDSTISKLLKKKKKT